MYIAIVLDHMRGRNRDEIRKAEATVMAGHKGVNSHIAWCGTMHEHKAG